MMNKKRFSGILLTMEMLRLTSDDIRLLTTFRHDLHQHPEVAGEDFALYGKHAPSFFFWVGSRMAGADIHELHTPQFFADDSAIQYAAELYAACAVR